MFIYVFDALSILAGPVSLPEVPGLGYQLPSNAVELAEPLPAPDPGQVWVLVNAAPVQLADYRGTVYRTDTGAAVEWSELGEVPGGYTSLACPGPYYVWAGEQWVLDAAAEAAATTLQVLGARDDKLRAAALRIAPLQYGHDLGESTAQEEAALLSWKRYSMDLNRIEQQAGYPSAISWPVAPESAAAL